MDLVTPTVGHQTDTAAFSNKGRKENPAVSLNLLMDLIPYSPPRLLSHATLRSVTVHPVKLPKVHQVNPLEQLKTYLCRERGIFLFPVLLSLRSA